MSGTTLEHLGKLATLHARGVITDEEFATSILLDWVEDVDFPLDVLDSLAPAVMQALREDLREAIARGYRRRFSFIGPGEPPSAADDPRRRARLKGLGERLGLVGPAGRDST